MFPAAGTVAGLGLFPGYGRDRPAAPLGQGRAGLCPWQAEATLGWSLCPARGHERPGEGEEGEEGWAELQKEERSLAVSKFIFPVSRQQHCLVSMLRGAGHLSPLCPFS